MFIPKTTTKAASTFLIIAMALSATLVVPAFSRDSGKRKIAEIQWIVDEDNYKEAIVTVNGQEFYLTASLSGDVWKITSINGVEQHSNWGQLVWIPRPPYPWWIPMGNVPAFRMHLDGATAINTATALAVATVLLGAVAGVLGGPLAGAVVAILLIGYPIMWSADHAADNSFDLWVPYDWYNVLLASTVGVYLATLRYWWFAYLKVIPWIVGTHNYWG